jgi:hypothetical protein
LAYRIKSKWPLLEAMKKPPYRKPIDTSTL